MLLYFKLKKRIIIVIVLSPLLTLRILGRVFLGLYFLWCLISFSYIYHHPLLCAQLLMLFCLIWRSFSQSVPLIMYFGRFNVHCKDWLTYFGGIDSRNATLPEWYRIPEWRTVYWFSGRLIMNEGSLVTLNFFSCKQ